MKCKVCENPAGYKYEIKKFKYWRLDLFENQSYLGRIAFVLKRHGEDLFEISEEEKKELFDIVKLYKKNVSKLFKPDLFNYASQGNNTRHLHLHIMPRYIDKRLFDGTEFIDTRWGENYAPAPELTLEDKLLFKIIEAIRKEI